MADVENKALPEQEEHQKADQYGDTVLQELKEKAQNNLDRIGFVNAIDIIKAFSDKDRTGKYTTCMRISELQIDPSHPNNEREIEKVVTMEPLIKLEEANDYTTLILQYPSANEPELLRIWNVLEEFGAKRQENELDLDLIPTLQFSAVPMSLGGCYGMICTDPMFWTLQPVFPNETGCRQIRILFEEGNVLFLRDETFDVARIETEVKNRIAAEAYAETNRQLAEEQAEQDRKEHEEEMQKYRQRNKERGSFRSTSRENPKHMS